MSHSCNCDCFPGASCEGPAFHERESYELDRSILSVQTEVEKSVITASWDIPDGKILRVNKWYGGEPKYFQWDGQAKEWKDISIQYNTPYNPETNKVATMTDIQESLLVWED